MAHQGFGGKGFPGGGRGPRNKKVGALKANFTHFLDFPAIRSAAENIQSLCCCVVLSLFALHMPNPPSTSAQGFTGAHHLPKES